MENLSDALIMAGQVLIFIVALSVCISSFTTLRIGIDEIVGQTETVEMVKEGEAYINYIDGKNAKATRVVGIETVVSSMYRSIKENYVIYIVAENNCDNLIGHGSSAVDLITATSSLSIGGKTVIREGQEIIKVTIGNESNQEVNDKLKGGFYDRLSKFPTGQKRSFYEYLGEYQNASSEGVTSENKQTHRVITYIDKKYMDNLS